MRIYLVVASINELVNLYEIRDNKHEIKVIVVDEGDGLLRDKNKGLLSNLDVNFYGPRERIEWFRTMDGSASDDFASVIPGKCHAETSFGFLVACEEDAEVIIEIDDDVKVVNKSFIDNHLDNLYSCEGITIISGNKWYNTIDNLKLDTDDNIFPRGHPYDLATRSRDYRITGGSPDCVLNMGVWGGQPDLDALTILSHGGLDGRCNINSKAYNEEKVIAGKGTYFAICSMNASFRRKVIPAFYQLYMRYMDIDRFDDILSGIFLKKIADHLGDKICLGKPIVIHDKRPRDTWKDLRAELEGMIINESLWRIIDALELSGNDYHESYCELAEDLEKSIDKFQYKIQRDFMKVQIEKMKLWLKIIDKLNRG